MNRMVQCSLLAAILAGCAAAPPAARLAADAPTCVALNRIVATRPAGPAAIDVELVGGRIYLNQLASVCPGLERLERFGAVAITSGAESGRLCRGDRVRIFDAAVARATGLQSFPECVLGDFVPRH